jgi:NADH-quinone oxidoreductase subunit H
MLGYSLPFLGAVIALAIKAGSFRLVDVIAQPFGLVTVLALIAFVLAVPARLKSNPFSIPNAEQEIVAGAHIEYNGPALALFELAHGLELVAVSLLFGLLFLPRLTQVTNPLAALAAYLVAALVLVVVTSLLAAATARLQIHRAFRFYWTWGAVAALACIVVAVLR